MGESFLFSTDYQLPLTEYEDFVLTYPGLEEMEAAGMWQTQTVPSAGRFKGESEPVVVEVNKVTSEEVETTSPANKVVVPPDSKHFSDKFQEPLKSGLGLAGNGIDFSQATDRMVTSICVPIHKLTGASSSLSSKPPSKRKKNVRREEVKAPKKRRPEPKFFIKEK